MRSGCFLGLVHSKPYLFLLRNTVHTMYDNLPEIIPMPIILSPFQHGGLGSHALALTMRPWNTQFGMK